MAHGTTCRAQKHPSVNILAGNGFPKSPQAYCITQGTCGVHVGELTGLLWGANVGVNIPKYCEMNYSHLRQRAFPDSSGLVLHPGDVWEVPGYFYPPCSGVQDAVNSKTLFSCSQRWSEPDFGDLPSSPQIYPEDNWHCSEVYGSCAKYL